MQAQVILLLAASVFQPQIPRTWTADAVRELEVPLAWAEFSARHISETEYYRIPERVIHRTYPVSEISGAQPPGRCSPGK